MTYLQKVVIGDATLYEGDCMEVMADLQAVHHVITDPPYETEAHAQGQLFAPVQAKQEQAALI